MIPIQLTIEGIYSYQDKQIIDFTDLIDAGLFGIFGSVGSGKSSILEAITFALYGETERLNARDKRAYNMMNLKSNRSYIEFDFVNFENKTFKITREFKRNSKRFDEVKSPTVVFYELKNEEWIPLDHANAELIIGLSYSNFKRTIIIPQGQFKEFIELGAKDRTQMMKEIFNLHRFDLQDKVGSINKINQSKIDQLEGKLSGFDAVSEDGINALKKQLEELNAKANQINIEYKIENEKFQQLKSLKTDFESLNQKKISFKELDDKKEAIDLQKNQLTQYELIYHAFHQLLVDQEKLSEEISLKSKTIEDQNKQLINVDNQIESITNQIKTIQADYDSLPEKRKQETDFDLLVQILTYTKEIEQLKERTKNGELAVIEVQKKEQEINDFIRLLSSEVEQLFEQKIDSKILLDVENWFTIDKNLSDSILNQKEKINKWRTDFEQINQQFVELKIEENSFEKGFESQFIQLELKKKEVEKQKTNLEVQQKIAHHAHNLVDGEACPLCGSTEHPKVVEMDDVLNEINTFSTQILEFENELKLLQNKKNQIHQLLVQKQFLNQQLVQEEVVLNDLVNQQKDHSTLFVWKEFNSAEPEIFHLKKKASLNVEELIEQKQKLIAEQRNLLEIERLNVEKYKKKLEELKSKEVEKNAQIQQNCSNLQVLKVEDFNEETVDLIETKSIQLKKANLKLEQDYGLFNQHLNDSKLKFSSLKSAIEVLEQQINSLQKEHVLINQSIKDRLSEHALNNLDEVKQILSWALNVQEIRKQIEEFQIAYISLNIAIQELEQKFKHITFDEDAYKTQELKVNDAELQLKNINESVSVLNAEIVRLSKAYEEKKDLLKEMDALQKRAANLSLLRNLFISAGFVQYVSSIYLKQLCENANVRFHRMTRNQLSLQLNENNDFEIVDFLNEGRSRSVKTLSGGQAFQVSLCLALALAESVQTNAKAVRNFFFIDEGFGTQDQEAINIVFETLMSLQKEQRIVGIISHVEELKERIPLSLSIVKDEEYGSQIFKN